MWLQSRICGSGSVFSIRRYCLTPLPVPPHLTTPRQPREKDVTSLILGFRHVLIISKREHDVDVVIKKLWDDPTMRPAPLFAFRRAFLHFEVDPSLNKNRVASPVTIYLKETVLTSHRRCTKRHTDDNTTSFHATCLLS